MAPSARRSILTAATPVLACALVAALLVAPPQSSAAANPGAPTLYVWVPTEVKSVVLERALQARLPALSVTVFGRFRDFDEALAAKRPDAILVMHRLLETKGMKATLRGVEAGQDFDNLVLVSAGAPLAGPLDNRTIGVVDVIGRQETQDLVVKLTATPTVKVKLVTKNEDLLSLLQFSAADAVLVRGGILKGLTERTRLSLYVREMPGEARVGRASVAVLSPAARDVVVGQIQALDAATNRMLAIDGWRLAK